MVLTPACQMTLQSYKRKAVSVTRQQRTKQFVIDTLLNVWKKAKNNIEEAHARQKAQYDKKVKPVQYNEKRPNLRISPSNSGRRKQKTITVVARSIPDHNSERTKPGGPANHQERIKRTHDPLQSGKTLHRTQNTSPVYIRSLGSRRTR